MVGNLAFIGAFALFLTREAMILVLPFLALLA